VMSADRDAETVERARDLTSEAMDALAAGDERRASVSLARAVSRLEGVERPEVRWAELGPLGALLVWTGFSDLGLNVVWTVIQLDYELHRLERLVDDLVMYGLALYSVGDAKAKDAFTEAHDLAVGNERYADAASASTNLAVVFLNDGDPQSAEALLHRSLRHLAHEPFPETEIYTRLNMLEVWEALGEPAERRLQLARETVEHLGPDLDPERRTAIAEVLQRIVEQARVERLELAELTWANAYLSELADEGLINK
jgi:hypothetical protein